MRKPTEKLKHCLDISDMETNDSHKQTPASPLAREERPLPAIPPPLTIIKANLNTSATFISFGIVPAHKEVVGWTS